MSDIYIPEDDFYDDICTECSIYGDDYYINDFGELECRCSTCFMNPDRSDDGDDYWED